MTHTEYKLIVKKEIFENAGYSKPAVHCKIGASFNVNESTFLELQNGKTVKWYTQEGIIEFDKYNFENEVTYTQVTIQQGTKKLGQRKNK